MDVDCIPGSFITIDRVFNSEDKIILILPMDLKVNRWPQGGVTIERGPIVYSLKIKENWQVDEFEPRQTKAFPAYTVTAASRWNYALDINEENLNERIRIVEKDFSGVPWWSKEAPVELHVPARKVKGWDTIKNVHIEETPEDILLYKMTQKHGCTIVLDSLKFTPGLPDPSTINLFHQSALSICLFVLPSTLLTICRV